MRLFQITEDDLAKLERVLPQLAESLTPVLSNKDRVHIRVVQTILSDVRWNYGPVTDVEIVKPEDE